MAKFGKLIESAIKKYAAEEYPKEACGVIVKVGKKLKAVKCVNVSDDPEHRFVIASDEYRKYCADGVYGIWHTHTDDPEPMTPSATDIAACNATCVDWAIVDVCKKDDKLEFGEFFHIVPEDDEADYIGRTYIYGVKDCFMLARDYYRKEFNIDVDFRAPGYPEITDWQDKGLNLLVDSYKEAGFVKLIDKEPVVGDLFLIQMTGSITDHVAIYIGDDRILHHHSGRLSNVDVYGGGYWYKHTSCHLRHSKFIEAKE